MQIDRLFEIIYILLDKKHITANQLASHFEVSKRTILRDLDVLTLAGIPIYTTKGKGGGISILDNFVLNKTTLSDEEQNQILVGLQSLSSTYPIKTDTLSNKLSALFQKNEASWIEVDFSKWGNDQSRNATFDTLKTSIINCHRITFDYYNTHGTIVFRQVHPLKLVYKSSAWYLQGFDLNKDDYRTFKVSRMKNIQPHPESFDKNKYDLPVIHAIDVSSTALIHLKLLANESVAYRVFDEFSEKHVQKNEDHTYMIDVLLPKDQWLYGYLLSFGKHIQILEPVELIEELHQYIKELETYYQFFIK